MEDWKGTADRGSVHNIEVVRIFFGTMISPNSMSSLISTPFQQSSAASWKYFRSATKWKRKQIAREISPMRAFPNKRWFIEAINKRARGAPLRFFPQTVPPSATHTLPQDWARSQRKDRDRWGNAIFFFLKKHNAISSPIPDAISHAWACVLRCVERYN